MGSAEGEESTGRKRATAAVVALVVLLAFWFFFLRGGDEYRITAEFENASQLVEGNQAVVGGLPVGTVERIDLGPEGQAIVTFTVNDDFAPLRRGTVATIRWVSLSSQAQRQVQLTPPPPSAGGEPIEDGGTLTQAETVAQVEIDQIFNTLDRETIRDFKRVIQGFERAFVGVEEEAGKGYKYMNPLFYQSRRVFGELSADDTALAEFLVDASRFSGALADRAPDVSQLVGNLNLMMTAIGDRKAELARAISLFPNFMRGANTMFVNLRAALDDVDPLITASKPAVRELDPFLDELRGFARDAVPTVRNLSTIIRRDGKDNDLVELTRLQPKVTDVAVGSGTPDCGGGPDPEDIQPAADNDFTQGSFGESTCSLRNGDASLEMFRAYTPELVGWFDGFSHSGYADALGGVGRVGVTLNTFSPSLPFVPNPATLQGPDEQFTSLDTGNDQRCPGSAERPLGAIAPNDDSVPFTDDGHLTDGKPGDCNPDHLIPGP
jgi:phospholipid/cholesterol/gamma-HCH transport system substrate-binding protein